MARLREAIVGKLPSDLMSANTQLNIFYAIVMEGMTLLFSPKEGNLHLFYDVMQLEVQPKGHVDTDGASGPPFAKDTAGYVQSPKFSVTGPQLACLCKDQDSDLFLLLSESRNLLLRWRNWTPVHWFCRRPNSAGTASPEPCKEVLQCSLLRRPPGRYKIRRDGPK